MMYPIRLGIDQQTRQPVNLSPDSFRTHYHLFGATGSGKTVAQQTLLIPILMEPSQKACVFLIDPLGNQSQDLLLWMASSHCPEHIRRRLVYFEAAREDSVLPFNPLRYHGEANRYFVVARTVDLLLRAWSAQDLSTQPRLMQWAYKTVCAMAMLNFPLALSRYLLHPGTREHEALLARIPEEVRYQWQEILNARSGEATRILESTRNRFDPFYESSILRRTFSAPLSSFDVERFIRERRIVIVNLAKLSAIPRTLGNTLGALMVNEILETIFNMATQFGREVVEPTYLVCDEFQRYAVTPDIEDAIPTARQMGCRLSLANQSMSQLEKSDISLDQIIWQCRSRLVFANSGEDADIIAQELATLTFDPMKVKDIRRSRRQLIVGYRKEWLESEGVTSTRSQAETEQRSFGYNRSTGDAKGEGLAERTRTTGHGDTRSNAHGETKATSEGHSHNRSQANVPIHETFDEVSSVTYQSFEEHRLEWQKLVRQLKPGQAVANIVGDTLRHVQVDSRMVTPTPRLLAKVEELKQRNFEQDLFISAAEADRLLEVERHRLLETPKIVIATTTAQPEAPSAFRKSRRTS